MPEWLNQPVRNLGALVVVLDFADDNDVVAIDDGRLRIGRGAFVMSETTLEPVL